MDYKRIIDYAEVFSGYAFSSEDLKEIGIPVIKIGNIQNGVVLKECENCYCKEISQKLKKYLLQDDDFLIAMTGAGSVGKAGKMQDKNQQFLVNQRVAIVRNNDNANPYFLFCFFRLSYIEKYLYSLGIGAGQPNISAKDIYKTKVAFPCLFLQDRIAAIFSKYDSLIELNNKRIKVLEQMAEELYKEWFVRFRFPGHESVEFENGIPKGWDYKRIGNLAEVKSGYAFKSEWWTDEGIPVIKIKDIISNTIDLTDLSKVSSEHAEKAKQFYVSAGDLLIALTGATIGKIAIVPYTEKTTVNQRVGKFFLKGIPWQSVAFLFCFFLQDKVQEEIFAIAGSNAAQPNISPFDVEKIKTYYSDEIVKLFNNKLSSLIHKILILRKQNENLTNQRDLLLPRLMSGKLEVN